MGIQHRILVFKKLGVSWVCVGPSWVCVGCVLGGFGSVLGRCWVRVARELWGYRCELLMSWCCVGYMSCAPTFVNDQLVAVASRTIHG